MTVAEIIRILSGSFPLGPWMDLPFPANPNDPHPFIIGPKPETI
jgi:hypothetical protein